MYLSDIMQVIIRIVLVLGYALTIAILFLFIVKSEK